MAPGRPVRDIAIKVPRHNADIIRKDLADRVQIAAEDAQVKVQLAQTPSEEVARAVESASEWNSLLMTARAERGPQWDIGTQQFHVDAYSELYYDPTSLLASTRKALGTDEDEEPQASAQDTSATSSRRQTRGRGNSQASLSAGPPPRREMDMLPRGAGMSPPRDMGLGIGGLGSPGVNMRPDMGGPNAMRGFPGAPLRPGMGMNVGNGMGGGGMGLGPGGIGAPGGMPAPGMNMSGGMGGGGMGAWGTWGWG
ncbi:hypothetical protein BD626DRAFT_631357 [Schizophyllum amplum]|uniref:Uncharacterized protein n=1 Tax=Schizophyllum amplum TaxID=97359 RepID=A0A550CA81_9AGAR|nr:hypothetical protein BD626DRAFT_631357 [Auriculariopsis ampla]